MALDDIDSFLGLDLEPPVEDSVSADALGEWLGLTAAHLHKLARDGVLPRGDDKRFPLKSAVQSYAQHMQDGATGKLSATPDLAAAKLALTEANALKVELQNAKARGDLLDAATVRAEWLAVAADLRSRLLSVPSRIAARLSMDRAATAALDAEMRRAMEDLSESDHAT